MGKLFKNKFYLVSIPATAIIYCAILLAMPGKDVFWTTDCGNKFIVLQNLEKGNGLSIQYPAEYIDLEKSFFPYASHHFTKPTDNNNNIVSFYPFYFPLFSLIFYKIYGILGLYLLPLISTLLCLPLVFLISRTIGLKDSFALSIIFTAFATPLLFYSFVFWEHSTSVLLTTASVLLILRNMDRTSRLELVLAGILTGLATVLREEGYVFSFATLAALVLCTRTFSKVFFTAAGTCAIFILLWISNYYFYGHFAGIHAAGFCAMPVPDTVPELILQKLSDTTGFLFSFRTHGMPYFYGVFVPVFAAMLLISGFLPGDLLKKYSLLIKTFFLIVLMFCSLLQAVFFMASESPVFDTLFTQGLFASTPFLFIILADLKNLLFSADKRLRFLVWTSVIFTLTACTLLNRPGLAICWGPRHFLMLYPLLVPVSIYAAREIGKTEKKNTLLKSGFLRCVVVLFILSFLIQTAGLDALFIKKRGSAEIFRALEQQGSDIIVSDVFWLPEEMASLFYRKKFMALNSASDLPKIIRFLKKNDVKRFLLVLSPRKQFRIISNAVLKEALESVDIVSAEELTPEKMDFMKLFLLECSVKKKQTGN